MLDIAGKYEPLLQTLFTQIAFDPLHKFGNVTSYRDKYKSLESSWIGHEFVSVDTCGSILGYFRYNIDREVRYAYGLYVVNLSNGIKPSATFALDLKTCITDIFEKFDFSKLRFTCVMGNPIESSYDKLITKIGGSVVGIHKQDVRLLDGKVYDLKLYEVLKENYLTSPYKMGKL
jgi:hypothetical protein